jgi:ferric-dicitrate binding protein FerR (iron transport regulator)
MEQELVAELAKIEEGYQAALWKAELQAQGVLSIGQYKAWLQEQPAHIKAYAIVRAEAAAKFLKGSPAADADAIRAVKVKGILRRDSAVLWAIGTLIGDEPLPTNPELVTHVDWVSRYIS